MVTSLATLWPWGAAAFFAAEGQQSLLQKLDPQKRASVLLALAGLVLLAFGCIVLIYLGARYVKRIARQRPPQRRREISDWKRNVPAERFPPRDESDVDDAEDD